MVGLSTAVSVAYVRRARGRRTLVSIDPAAFVRVATLNDAFFTNTTAAATMSALRNDPSALGEAAVVALASLAIGIATGAVMAYMFVKILVTLVLAGMGLSVALAARSLRRLNPVELLREE